MRTWKISLRVTAASALLAIVAMTTPCAHSQSKLHTLYSFPSYKEGDYSVGKLVSDAFGNIYGTTEFGGPLGNGSVFMLSRQASGVWTETVLHNFAGGNDGVFPCANLIFDAAGNLYGTTRQGGPSNSGTVFELSPTSQGEWTETVLYSFSDSSTDGMFPYGGLVFDSGGNLYGTTYAGIRFENGTVFQLSRSTGGVWQETVLHHFVELYDGRNPQSGLTIGPDRGLYGTTVHGGAYDGGTIFELLPTQGQGWVEKILYNFQLAAGSPYLPYASVVFDPAGDLYTTTFWGGDPTNWGGSVFELSPSPGGLWAPKMLHSFGDPGDGFLVYCDLVLDAAGNLYGTTNGGGAYGFGTVFKLAPKPGGMWGRNDSAQLQR
jgi:uncharacterized repeat protein (TIGR03803 family)